MNADKQKSHRDFMDFMYSLGLYPTILKPSRIATGSATLIDNIFSNKIGNTIASGLLIKDISDHLPVFIILKNFFKNVTHQIDSQQADDRKLVRYNSLAAITTGSY